MKSPFRVCVTFGAAIMASSLAAACNKADSPQAAQGAQATADTLLAAVNDSLARMNYGEAARLATDAQAQFPGDYRLHAAAARAQARLGAAETSATALGRAIAAGLPSPAEVLADPAFDLVRNHHAFAPFRARTAVSRSASTDQPTSHIRAGDVEIIESADGDVIRAGDVVLDTRQ